MTSRSQRYASRRNRVPVATLVATAVLFAVIATACTSLPAAADRYFTEAVVGALDIADSGRVTGFTVLDPAVNRYDLFLAGEAHGIVENLDGASDFCVERMHKAAEFGMLSACKTANCTNGYLG